MLHLKLMIVCEKRQGVKSTCFTSLRCGLASVVSNGWLPLSWSFFVLSGSLLRMPEALCLASALSNSGTINSTSFSLSTIGSTLLFIGKVFSLQFNAWNLSIFLPLKKKNKTKLSLSLSYFLLFSLSPPSSYINVCHVTEFPTSLVLYFLNLCFTYLFQSKIFKNPHFDVFLFFKMYSKTLIYV